MAEKSLSNLYATKANLSHTHAGTDITSVVANATNAVNATNATTATNATNATNASYVPFSGITSKPTTLAGYGITDAVLSSDVVTTATANKILRLNASGLLPASITGNAATATTAASATTATTATNVAFSGITGKPTTVSGYGITDGIQAVSDGNYYGLKDPTGNTVQYIRTTTNGILPSVPGGSGYVGTSSWPFLAMYANIFYGTFNGTHNGTSTTALNIPISDSGGNIWIA